MWRWKHWCKSALFPHCPSLFLHGNSWKGLMSLNNARPRWGALSWLPLCRPKAIWPPAADHHRRRLAELWRQRRHRHQQPLICFKQKQLVYLNQSKQLAWTHLAGFCLMCVRKWTSHLFCWQKSGWGGTVHSSIVLSWIVKNFSVNGLTVFTGSFVIQLERYFLCVDRANTEKQICIDHSHVCREKDISALDSWTVKKKQQPNKWELTVLL